MTASIERWIETLALLGLQPTPALLDLGHALLVRYAETHRHYHTLAHLDACLDQARDARSACERAGEVEFALWFHDAIYDTRRSDNEQRSAEWAQQSALAAGIDAAAAKRIHALVMATRHAALPATGDAALLVDIDLSILGAESARFDEYEREVRREYHWVPEFMFQFKRRQLLREFLLRRQIFATPRYHDALEARARANLTRSIAR